MALTLKQFFAEMDRSRTNPTLQALIRTMEQLDVEFEDIETFAKFSPHSYQRNLIHQGPHYQALILCWKNGQRSPIHDHRGSACGVRIIKGVATETLFEKGPNGHIRATFSRDLHAGQVCGSYDDDIHQVSNLQAQDADLITLHVYSPPLLKMGTYSLTDTRVGEFVDPIFEFAHGAGI